jgi:hypothetical protein
MKKIDEYVENIYKNFDETEEDTKILIEETKSHLYEEVEELKKQGLGENESIERAVINFGKENIVIEEMDSILIKQSKFSKILIRVALMVYIIGSIFKVIFVADEFLTANHDLQIDKLTSDYVIQIISDKIENKEFLDENIKEEITTMLDNFNVENNGIYYIGLEKTGEYSYEYSKKLSEDLMKISGSSEYGGGENSGGKSVWTLHYKTTGYQAFLDSFYHELEMKRRQNEIPYNLNKLSNYIFIISWILVCVALINKAYIKDLLSKSYLAFFICPTIFILGVFATGKHTPEESMILLTGIMIFISKFYSQNYFKKKLQVE